MIITRLEQILGDLSPSEKKVAQYILDNPKETIKLSVQEIAEASMSSSAAVVRLCKHIDVKGFTELKNMLFDSLSGSDNLSKPYYVPDFDKEADGKAIINKLVSSVCQNAQMLTAILSNKDVEKAAKLILSAKKILFIGIGASRLVALDFQQKLMRIGIVSSAPDDYDLMLLSSSGLGEDDVVVSISYSGETPIVKKATKTAKNNGAKVIAITRYGSTTLSHMADCLLNVPASESTYRQGATISRISQLMVVDVLYSTMIVLQDNSRELISKSFEMVKAEHDSEI
ncbi:MAG: MurR/RpiR family transcriptional regulator [Spirochaetales bacterium]|nr:MurR/RpiR family transcriptional regulator [Spirochaetales bacterium]